jgi:AraC family L-rhamnose operon transcriptional activator RhaR/AraC family L-rhamnose operon regulatory protein RhaS
MKYGIIRNSGASATNYLRIRPAVEYIEKNFNQKITVSQLSALLSVCDDHCIRLFKAAVSKTPTEYITDVRLRQGLKLLTDQKYSVQMISELCGFSNVSYFSRVFREKLGMTPSEFRRSV